MGLANGGKNGLAALRRAGAWWALLLGLLLSPLASGSGFSYDDAEPDGPSNWYKFYPACGGSAQSPIDISSASVVNLNAEYLGQFFTTLPVIPLTFLNNGHSLQLTVSPRLVRIAGSTFPNLEDGMQFHFHTPSEHTVNGKHFDMEYHFVFNSSNRATTGALSPLVVIGIFFQISSTPSPLLAQLLPYLTNLTYAGNSTSASIIPEFPSTGLQFWEYQGSLTTPPCYEIVHWLVSTTVQSATREQIDAFAAIMKDNARPVQPLNGRQLAKRLLVPQNVDNYFVCPSSVTCGSQSIACSIVSAPNSPSTLCATSTCTQTECCGALTTFATVYLAIVLATDCTSVTQTSFKALIQQATGIPAVAVVITTFACSSLTIYLTTTGSTAALANNALNLISQAALSGALGPVVSVGIVQTPGPLPSATTTTTTQAYYPTYPTFPAGSSSNPALFALFTLLVIPIALIAAVAASMLRRPAAPACPSICALPTSY